MYSLYVDKEKCEIVLKKMGKIIMGNPTEDVTMFNNCYYISKNRKALKQKGLEIKEKWISETKKELEKIESIKI